MDEGGADDGGGDGADDEGEDLGQQRPNRTERERTSTEATMVVMLTARFSGTARRGGYPSGPTSTGSRNSAPPSPISPPSVPIGTAKRNASPEDRRSSVALVPIAT